MKKQVLAVIIQEGTRVLSEVLKTNIHRKVTSIEMPAVIEPPPLEVPPSDTPKEYRQPVQATSAKENTATSIKSGCVPCAVGHVGVCSGLLKEAVRFARDEGVASESVLDRTGICLDELNAMERVDMSPAMLKDLPPDEREIADRVLVVSRRARHAIESLASPGSSVRDLEDVAAELETTRKEIWRDFVKVRTDKMDLSQEQKDLVEKTVIKKIEEIEKV